MPEVRTLYVNQNRVMPKDDKFHGEWCDCCEGHDTMYDAIQCGDHQKGLLSGNLKPDGEDERDWAREGREIKTAGKRIDWRIVKRVQMDEVVE